MSNSIAKDFKFFSLLRFAFPTMVMMVFMSLYTIIDGIFVSRLVGTNALSALNIAYPAISLVIAIGVMFATGGSAIIAKKLGEKKDKEARSDFSTLILTGIILGILFLVIGSLFSEPIVRLLGATDALTKDAVDYLVMSLYFAPACILQLLFQSFFVTAGKPNFGLLLTITGGIANIVLDYVFMRPLKMGVTGAALATGIGQLLPAFFGLLYFLFVRSGSLYLVKPHFYMTLLTESSLNYSMGVAPVISYNHGRNHLPLLRRIFKICIGFISVSSLIITGLALISSPVIVEIFTPRSSETYEIAKNGFFLFSINYIFAGINIFASSEIHRSKRNLAGNPCRRIPDNVFIGVLLLQNAENISLSLEL